MKKGFTVRSTCEQCGEEYEWISYPSNPLRRACSVRCGKALGGERRRGRPHPRSAGRIDNATLSFHNSVLAEASNQWEDRTIAPRSQELAIAHEDIASPGVLCNMSGRGDLGHIQSWPAEKSWSFIQLLIDRKHSMEVEEEVL